MARTSVKKLLLQPVVRHDLTDCPFCGSPPEIQYWHGGGPEKRLISCSGDECEVRPSVTGETEREAIRIWERRVP